MSVATHSQNLCVDKRNRLMAWSSKTLSSSCLGIKADKEKTSKRVLWFLERPPAPIFYFLVTCFRSGMAFPTHNNKTYSKTMNDVISNILVYVLPKRARFSTFLIFSLNRLILLFLLNVCGTRALSLEHYLTCVDSYVLHFWGSVQPWIQSWRQISEGKHLASSWTGIWT